MGKFRGINHLALVTGNMDMTIRFWRDLLGLPLIAGLGREDFKQYFFEICKGSYISFYEWPEVVPINEKDAGRAAKGKIALDHVAIAVAEMDNLWQIKDKIEASGEWVSEVVDNGFIYSLFTFDPNNISVEICCALDYIDPDKDLKMSDPYLSKIAQEGKEPRIDVWPKVENPTLDKDRKVYPGDLKSVVNGKDYWLKD